jgi:DNA-binding NarL/FixJ family response regulator
MQKIKVSQEKEKEKEKEKCLANAPAETAPLPAKIRIVIADDHPVVREGLIYILNTAPDLAVVGEASDGLEVVEMVSRLKPDVVLMDLQMPRLNGVEAIKRLTAEDEQMRVIILTTFENDEYIFEGIRAGAKGYLLKDTPKEDLCQAVRLVMRGQFSAQPSLTSRLLSLIQKSAALPSKVPSLTERELEVLKLLATGDRNKEIGLKLGLTESTVKGYVASLFEKFGVSDRTAAARYALQKGLIKLD